MKEEILILYSGQKSIKNVAFLSPNPPPAENVYFSTFVLFQIELSLWGMYIMVIEDAVTPHPGLWTLPWHLNFQVDFFLSDLEYLQIIVSHNYSCIQVRVPIQALLFQQAKETVGCLSWEKVFFLPLLMFLIKSSSSVGIFAVAVLPNYMFLIAILYWELCTVQDQ